MIGDPPSLAGSGQASSMKIANQSVGSRILGAVGTENGSLAIKDPIVSKGSHLMYTLFICLLGISRFRFCEVLLLLSEEISAGE